MGAAASRASPEAMAAARQLIEETVRGHKVVVWSKSYCPYCTKAKRALAKYLSSDKVYVIELDERRNGGEIQDALAEVTGGRSVPRVFVDGQFIGGGDDTDAAARNGKLEVMLRKAGVL